MTDETRNEETQADSSAPRDGRGALRKVLIAIIVLLLLGMGVLGYIFLGMLKPVGAPQAQTGAGEMEWVRSIYGYGPGKTEQLLDPTAVAIAPNGDIYANDPQRKRVMRFGSDGAFKALVASKGGANGAGKIERPEDIATDVDGNLYIADSLLGKIVVYNDQGTFVREWKTARPYGVNVSADLVFVMTNGVVSVYDRNGASKGSFGKRGSARDQIDAGKGMVSDGKLVYIADALNSRIACYDPKGKIQWISPEGAAPRSAAAASHTVDAKAPFDLPQDLVLDGSGRLVVIDAFKFQIIVMDKKGKILAHYGDAGSEDGLFFYPTSIDYDAARDWFAVADTRNGRVQIVRLPGSGETTAASARRLVTSPYRYCAVPLLLALLALIVALVTRRRQRRRQAADGISDGAAEQTAERTGEATVGTAADDS